MQIFQVGAITVVEEINYGWFTRKKKAERGLTKAELRQKTQDARRTNFWNKGIDNKR